MFKTMLTDEMSQHKAYLKNFAMHQLTVANRRAARIPFGTGHRGKESKSCRMCARPGGRNLLCMGLFLRKNKSPTPLAIAWGAARHAEGGRLGPRSRPAGV